jgi:gas vesicle protein
MDRPSFRNEVSMYYDDESPVVSFISGLVVGVAIGAGLALLLAPESGRRTRRKLARSVEGIRDTASDRWDGVSGDLRSAVKSSRKKLNL